MDDRSKVQNPMVIRQFTPSRIELLLLAQVFDLVSEPRSSAANAKTVEPEQQAIHHKRGNEAQSVGRRAA